ncbi:MAG: hypothetical protein HXS44_14310 [Theionarchaea archaeon]|nr:hypothetical protein [Theionarchaea archaeon]
MQKRILAAVLGTFLIMLAISTLVASSQINTPLYARRMEQASSKMNFLPTEMNGFTYSTEQGYILNYGAGGCCGGPVLDPVAIRTIDGTCVEPTCPDTCRLTCDDPTCEDSCPVTCPLTCDTCTHTCASCEETCSTCVIFTLDSCLLSM